MYVAFDVGGTFVKHGILSREGRIAEKGKYPTNCRDEDIFIGDMRRVIEIYGEKYSLEGIAVAMPGIIDVDTGHMREAGAVLSLYGKNIKELLGGVTDLPVEVENDANCVALAEKFSGNAAECEDFVCMTIGTGIGGGVVINNRIHHGRGFMGGEFGHMRIDNRRPDESLHDNCSTRGLINMYREYMGIDKDRVLGGHDVFNAALEDEGAAGIVDRWYRNISIAVYNLAVTLCPQRILIGGGVSERKEFLERVEELLNENENWNNLGTEVGICKHKNDAGILGALYHFLSRRGGEGALEI